MRLFNPRTDRWEDHFLSVLVYAGNAPLIPAYLLERLETDIQSKNTFHSGRIRQDNGNP